MMRIKFNSPQDCGLIVQQSGNPQQVLVRFLNLMLNYQCGLSLRVADDFERGAGIVQKEGQSVRCAFVVQNVEITRVDALLALSQNGAIPVFLVLPQKRLDVQQTLVGELKNIYLCSWEGAFLDADHSLQQVARDALEARGVCNIFRDLDNAPYSELQERLENRLRNLNTLPTLPEIIMRIMRLVNDPKTTTDELERLLGSDPAIVMKLLKVVRSPIFAGISRSADQWSLTDVIVRLGYKKVGGIAQQIKLINNLVKPSESEFDLRRFWEHSIGCALIADRLYSKGMIKLGEKVEFNDYWIGSLLHDVGKLVLGFFFWDWFARIIEQCEKSQESFRAIEAKMGDVASHERVGQMLIINANMGEELANAVGSHHFPGEQPSSLACLIHMANNLCNELGLGYLPSDKAHYDARVLQHLELGTADIAQLRNALSEDINEEVKSLVSLCL